MDEYKLYSNMWKDALEILKKNKSCDLGLRWGNINSEIAETPSGDVLGNYEKIKNEYLLPYLNEKSILMDLGIGGGKWTQSYKGHIRKLIAVDITQSALDLIKFQYQNDLEIEYYKSDGYNLKNIPSESVDFIFSMDSLMRATYPSLKEYFKEFNRVLKKKGKACIHVSYSDLPLAVKLGFTNLSLEEIEYLCTRFRNKWITFDVNTCKHGILIRVITE